MHAFVLCTNRVKQKPINSDITLVQIEKRYIIITLPLSRQITMTCEIIKRDVIRRDQS